MRRILQWRPTTIQVVLCLNVLFLLVLGAIYSGYRYNWEWVGVGEFTRAKTDTQEVQRAKTLWDWMHLLIVPLMLAIGGYIYNRSERRNELQVAERRAQTEREVAERREEVERGIVEGNQQEAALQAYLDRMAELIIDNDLRHTDEASKERVIARARTITVLKRLDPDRKAAILEFLHEANLIGDKPIIMLNGADFMKAPLRWVLLSKADLRHTDFREADLREADLSDTSLHVANLYKADLTEANLSHADLSYADLREADLTDANLTGANLTGARVTQEQLKKAKTLAGAVMDNLGSAPP